MWWLLGVVAVGVAVAMAFRRDPLTRAVETAISTADVKPVAEHVDGVPLASRHTAFDQAMRNLWERYERGLAARLARATAKPIATALVTQYWIKQILEVEPDVGREVFDDGFLEEVYHPDIAARCGRFG